MRTVEKEVKTTVVETIITPKDFEKWLEDQGCLLPYMENVVRSFGFNVVAVFAYGVTRLIDGAFPWFSTPQGYDYWAKIHKSWKKYCKENSIVEVEGIK